MDSSLITNYAVMFPFGSKEKAKTKSLQVPPQASNPAELLLKLRSTKIKICLTVKFRTSFVITVRKVRELHPVSRHVFPLPVSGQNPATTDGVLRVCFKVSGNFEKGEAMRPRTLTAWGILHTRTARRLAASVIDRPTASLCLRWLCASVLRVEQPARSTITCPPALYLMVRVTRAGTRRHSSLRKKKYWEKVFFFFPA